MKIIEFDDHGSGSQRRTPVIQPKVKSSEGATIPAVGSIATKPAQTAASNMKLHLFQTGSLRTKVKYIKMNQGEDDFEIPVPWFLIEHPAGNVVIDGGNAIEVAMDKRAHWGDVIDAYDPVMDLSENCVEQCRSVGVDPLSVRYVLQSHLHLDHTGALGHFPNAQIICQREEYEYAFKPHWFSDPAYIRADFSRPGLDWKLLSGIYNDPFDLFGDGSIRTIFTPGHAPGHQSFLITLPRTGPVLLTIDAAYTLDHWENRALPGLVVSAADAAESVEKLRRIASDTNAMIVTGHDPDNWLTFKKAPEMYYN